MASSNSQYGESEVSDGFAGLRELVESCREWANAQGERFNIFSILGAERDETNTHSRFLAEMLNPRGLHGEGKRLLQAFVRGPLGREARIGDPVRVKRELLTDEGRQIDLAIETPELLIGIEVKIDAGDQDAQLRDYHKELERRATAKQEVVLVYLTLNGGQPSKPSLADLDPKMVDNLSFARDIREWVETCSTECSHKAELSHALIQYRHLVENLTGSRGSARAMISERLIEDTDDLRAALDVEKALPSVKAKIMHNFWEELARRLEDRLEVQPRVYGSANLPALSNDFFLRSQRSRNIGIKVPVCQSGSDTVYLYIHLYHAIHYGLVLEDASGHWVTQKETRDWFRQKTEIINGTADKGVADKQASWLVCYYYDPDATGEQVVLNFEAFNEGVLALLEDGRREMIIGQMVDHQVRLVERARSLFEQGDG